MKRVILDMNDIIFEKVMFLLNNLPKNKVRIKIEDNEIKRKVKKLKAISLKTKGFKFDRDEANAR